MRPADNIEKHVKNNKLHVCSSSQMDEKILGDSFDAMEQAMRQKQAEGRPGIWRYIMHNRKARFVTLVFSALVVLIGVVILDQSVEPAWAIDQSVEALSNIETATVYCECRHFPSFKAYIKRDIGDWNSFRAYAKTNDGSLAAVVRDNIYFHYIEGCREIYSMEMSDTGGPGMKFWNYGSKLAPVIGPVSTTLFKAGKLLASEWDESYVKDEESGRDIVFVTGSVKMLSSSFEVVFDVETKLVVRGKYWDNPERKGKAAISVTKVVYDEEVSEDYFYLEKMTDAKLLNVEETKKRWDLHTKAHSIGDGKYEEELAAYKELYETYPDYISSPEAINAAGWCYANLGKYDEAMGCYQKVLDEYTVPDWAMTDAWNFKAYTWKKMGENEKAIEAFETLMDLIKKRFKGKELHPNTIKHLEKIEKEIKELREKK